MNTVEYFGFRFPELNNVPCVVRRDRTDGPTAVMGLHHEVPFDWGHVWGFEGRQGARNLAVDLTREVLGVDRCTDELREAFLQGVIIRLPRIGWRMTAEAVEWFATVLEKKGEVLMFPYTGIEELRPPPREALLPVGGLGIPSLWLDLDDSWQREDDMKDLEEEDRGKEA
jgi:hypothetical protein